MPIVTGHRCIRCNDDRPWASLLGCEPCRAAGVPAHLFPVYAPDPRLPEQIKADWALAPRAGIWRFADRLPKGAADHAVTLNEGNTPLVRLGRLGSELGVAELWLKDESRNPTWSWKDRMMAATVSAAKAAGATIVAAASSGNAGASLAAYAARAGLSARIVTTEPRSVAMRALLQVYGAEVVVAPDRVSRFAYLGEKIRREGWYPATNWSDPPLGSPPIGIEGHKTIAFEIARDWQWNTPDVVIVPTSYGDGLFGIWRGFAELHALGLCQRVPRMIAVRPASGATVAFSLGRPAPTAHLIRALEETGGETYEVPEREILPMQVRLARREGLFLEASSVTALCSVSYLRDRHAQSVVVMGTSSGLKDPEPALALLPPLCFIP